MKFRTTGLYSPTKTKIKTETNIDYSQVAKMASGASGAELANIVNEAATPRLLAVPRRRPGLTKKWLSW